MEHPTAHKFSSATFKLIYYPQWTEFLQLKMYHASDFDLSRSLKVKYNWPIDMV